LRPLLRKFIDGSSSSPSYGPSGHQRPHKSSGWRRTGSGHPNDHADDFNMAGLSTANRRGVGVTTTVGHGDLESRRKDLQSNIDESGSDAGADWHSSQSDLAKGSGEQQQQQPQDSAWNITVKKSIVQTTTTGLG
jgi:hypothetical protein